jgi:hypothetical protein
LDQPGLYAWWVDAVGAELISTRLGEPVSPGIVYAGQAGAEKGRASAATLRSRLGGNHIGGRIRNSTFRLTAAAVLLEEVEALIAGDRRIGAMGERIVSDWLAAHFRVTVVPFADRGRLAAIESQVLAALDPPLNIEGMPATRLRLALGRRRARLRSATPGRPSPMPASPETRAPRPRRARAVTLHEEIAAILEDQGNRWMSTAEVAQLVNERGRYRKGDLSPVTAWQIHGRTRNYARLFDRDGARLRLRPAISGTA